MLHLTLLALTLTAGVVKEPFRVAQSSVGHHQVCLRAAMANDGRFAIAWVDSLQLADHFELDIYIRFFDKDGNPMTPACRLPKLYDTAYVNWPSLDMDSVGNSVLLWAEGRTASSEVRSKIRFQWFTPEGTFVGLPKTILSDVDLSEYPYVSLSNNGQFALAFSGKVGEFPPGALVQRFNLNGVPQDTLFQPHTTMDTAAIIGPTPALNDEGDLLVTWCEHNYVPPPANYLRFQVFDKNDNPLLPWEPKGHSLVDDAPLMGATAPKPHWIGNDRFLVFWTGDMYLPTWKMIGRSFSQKGAVKHPVRPLMRDSLFLNVVDYRGRFKTAVLPDGRFATTHTRSYSDFSTGEERHWEHAGGIIGKVVNNEPLRYTNLFEYSAPWGADTVNSFWSSYFHFQTPAVAASSDRLVWVYSRLNTDTIFEAWAVISDWDMGEDIVENPPIARSDFEIANPIGRQIVLRYSDCPEGFRASVFDVSGRKVDELRSTERSGMIVWGECYGPGMYFIVPKESKGNPLKVVLVR